MKAHLILAAICGLLTSNLSAQTEPADTVVAIGWAGPAIDKTPNLIPHITGMRGMVGAYFEGGINAQSLTTEFYKPWYQGGEITEAIQDGVKDRLGFTNLAGADLNYGVYYNTRIDSFCGGRQAYFFVDFSDRQHLNLEFSNDFFNLAFDGNKPFEGDSVQLADLSLNQYRYQYLKAGIAMPGNRFSWAAALGFIKGEKLQQFNIENAGFYTAPYGTELTLDLDLEQFQSDSDNTGVGAFNGWGMGSDLMFQYTQSDWGTIRFEVRDLGFISWNDKTYGTEIDSSYRWEGLVVNDLTDLTDSIYLDNVADSLRDAYTNVRNTQGTRTTLLPTWFHLQYGRYLGEKLSMRSGVMYRLAANYAPYFYIEGRYEFKFAQLWTRFGFGGYGKAGFGLGARFDLADRIYVDLGSQHLEGLVLPKSAGGIQAFARVSYRLGKGNDNARSSY